MYSKPLTIDWERTVAYASDLSGRKSYSYGGVRVVGNGSPNDGEYEDRREADISLLRGARLQDDERKLVEFAMRREDLYDGPYIDDYPDVVVQLRAGYGIGWSVKQGLFGRSTTKSLVPGTHKGDSATLAVRLPSTSPVRREVFLEDIAPTVYDLLGILPESKMDGTSLLQANG